MIQDMKEITVTLLKKFFESNKGRKPEKLVMFRDGVSEGQFLKVLANELVAMKEACRELEEGYEPSITYLVVQKRHHTRFFPADDDKTNVYRSVDGNNSFLIPSLYKFISGMGTCWPGLSWIKGLTIPRKEISTSCRMKEFREPAGQLTTRFVLKR